MGRVFRAIHRVEEVILAAAMLLMAALIIANVFARMLFNHSLAATEELSQFLIIIICFVGLSYAVGQGRHIRMTAIYDQLGRRARKVLMIGIAACTATLMLILAWLAWQYAMSVGGRSPVLNVPMRYIYLVAPAGLLLAGVQYVLVVIVNLRKTEVYLAYEKPDVYEEEEATPGV